MRIFKKHRLNAVPQFTCLVPWALIFLIAASLGSSVSARQRDELKPESVETVKRDTAATSRTETAADPAKKIPDPAKADPAEMARHLAELEARIRELESRLVKISEAAPAGTPTAAEMAAIKEEVATIQADAEKDRGFLNFFRKTEVSGIVDAYYSYNFNHPDGNNNTGRNFDLLHNNFNLNYVELSFEKKNDLTDPLGFRLDLGYGPTMELVHAADPGSSVIRHLQQAYISYVAPVGSGLTVDYGLFVTPHGAEVIETKDNFNYSRSFLFTYAIPYYHMGLRAKYSFNDKVGMNAFLVNGWNNHNDNNGGKTVGLGLDLTPTKRLAIYQHYMVGPEQTNDNTRWRHLYDATVSFAANDKLTLMANYDYGRDELSDGRSGHWSGLAAYLRYAFSDRCAFSPRFEVFNDHDGFTTGTAQTLKGITLTQEFKLAGNLLTRFEFRRDFSDHDFFSKHLGRIVGSQNTALIGFSYFFSTRGE
ncbi:MAG: porin [Acidobacteria bacterium]|nr:porin [Acidobacteriota bacterium]